MRSKANFGILEGFLSELLHDDIHILEILDGESNQETRESKFNRVDIKVRNQGDKRVLLDKAGFAIDTPVTIKVMDGFLTLTTEQLATNS